MSIQLMTPPHIIERLGQQYTLNQAEFRAYVYALIDPADVRNKWDILWDILDLREGSQFLISYVDTMTGQPGDFFSKHVSVRVWFI